MARPAISKLRIGLQVGATLVLMASIGLVAYASLTTGWQVVQLEDVGKKGEGVRHEHGLWIVCKETDKHNPGHKVSAGSWTCGFRSGDEHIVHHRSLAWVNTVFGLVVASAALGLIGLLCSLIGLLFRIASVIWSVLCFLATVILTVGLIYFYRFSLDGKYDTEKGKGLYYEMELGYSFWAAVWGALGLFVATILSILATVMQFATAKRQMHHSPGERPRNMRAGSPLIYDDKNFTAV